MAVVNKAVEQKETTPKKEEDQQAAEDRISNTYGPPEPSFNAAPVYGPPEITGDYRPAQVFPSPPPEQPPPISSYDGPLPRRPAVPFNPPKQSYGPPPSGPRPNYGPPKSRYGPPNRGRPSFGPPPFRAPRPKYGPPPQSFNPGQGSQIPSSLEAYGPPSSGPAPSFNVPHKEYGVPQNQYGPPSAPSNQYGPPSSPSNQYGPPPAPSNQYGPPSSPSNQYGPPSALSNQYGPPAPSNQYGPPSAPSNQYGPPPAPSNQYGPPSNQYGPPSNQYGPPPQPQNPFRAPQPQYGPPRQQIIPPLPGIPSPPPAGVPAPPTPPDIKYDGWQPIAGHVNAPENTYGPPDSNQQTAPTNVYGPPENNQQQDTYAPPTENFLPPAENYKAPLGHHPQNQPSVEPELLNLITSNNLNSNVPSDSYGVPLNNPEAHSLKSQISEVSTSLDNTHKGLPPPPLPQLEPFHLGKGPGDTQIRTQGSFNGPEPLPAPEALSGQNHNFAVQQQLPTFSPAQFKQQPQPLYAPPPRPQNSYSPPPQNFGPPQSNSFFNKVSNIFSFGNNRRPPPATLTEHFVPPRPLAPTKFKEAVPSNVFSSLNRLLPPNANLARPLNTYGLPTESQLPNLSPPVTFQSALTTGINTVLAAPSFNYGTPISFNSFNTPAPLLSYGVPNFVGPTPLVPDSIKIPGNLYNNIGQGLPNVYGRPLFNGQNGLDAGPNCGQFEHSAQLNAGLDSNNQVPAQDNRLFQPQENSLESNYKTPSVNELELENSEQQTSNLKDSYGNPVGVTFEDSDSASANLQSSSLNEGYAEAKHFGSGIEAAQYFNNQGQQFALAQATAGADGFQIQGSQGVYTLQIQPADGGLGTENSDGSIRHEQILSNDLIQDIIAAIEQPQGIQLQGLPNQATDQGYASDLHHAASSAIVSEENVHHRGQVKKDVDRQTATTNENKPIQTLDKEKIALFVNNDYIDSVTSANQTSQSKDTEY